MPTRQNYHTRPMPGGWSKQRDAIKLSETRAEFEWDIAVAELPGVADQLLPDSGPFHVRLRFGTEQGLHVVRLELQGPARLTCQCCMRPMTLPLSVVSNVALVSADSEADAVPEGWETFLASEGRLTGAALVTEELLLTLPVVPLHTAPADCAERASVAQAQPAQDAVPLAPETDQARTRPFAGLRALLDRDTH